MRQRLIFCLWCLAASTVFAQNNNISGVGTNSASASTNAGVSALNYKGLVIWDALALAKKVKVNDRFQVEFPKAVEALNGKEVKIQGFMLPMQAGNQQKRFLLTANSPSCEYCVPAGPEGLIEVTSKATIPITFDPITLSGRLELLKDDFGGMYYRMPDAVLSTLK